MYADFQPLAWIAVLIALKDQNIAIMHIIVLECSIESAYGV